MASRVCSALATETPPRLCHGATLMLVQCHLQCHPPECAPLEALMAS